MTIGANDLLQDVASTLGPDAWLGVGVVMSHVLVYGSHQFLHTGEHAAAQSLFADVSEEPFHHVEP